MHILSIGNSFSVDATTYLHDMAKRSGKDINTANLCIGGCSLEKHFRNYLADNRDYTLQFNGVGTGFRFSIREALLSHPWDVVTIQQVSHQSPYPDTYTPYIEFLVGEIRKLCPKVKLLIHKTWAYEEGSERLFKTARFETSDAMFEAITNAYEKAALATNVDGIIPAGDVMFRLSKANVGLVHRDTFHASLGIGRYAVAMTWLRYLTGVDVTENDFSDTAEPVSEEQMAAVKGIVSGIVPLA